MNTLQELREYIKAAGVESPAAHAHISGAHPPPRTLAYSSSAAFIESHILTHPNALFKRRVPPLDIILFALRALLAKPAQDIPDVLDFATTIEVYRALALTKIDEALTIHEYYQVNDRLRTALTPADAASLREYQNNAPTLRAVYLNLILQFCQLVSSFLSLFVSERKALTASRTSTASGRAPRQRRRT
jgi:hypothetical protein